MVLHLMDSLSVILVLVIGFIVTAWYVQYTITRAVKDKDTSKELFSFLQQDRKILVDSLSRNTDSVNQRLDSTARVISDVQKHVGEMSEIGRSMKDLQEYLHNPKLRGTLGEHILSELLSQMLPKQSFFLQYTFRSGEKVDAAIKTSGGLIPVDSKFPMSNFRKLISAQESEKAQIRKDFEKDVRAHVKAIGQKYIIPTEGTVDYALMYVPSESMFYEIVNNQGLYEYAASERVLPVSPTTFYAYLHAILMSFEGQKIEEQAKEILRGIRTIEKDYTKLQSQIQLVTKHMNNAQSALSQLTSQTLAFGHRLMHVSSLSGGKKSDTILPHPHEELES